MSDALTKMLSSKLIVLADGATGTHLRKLLRAENKPIPQALELLNLESAELVRFHHREYIQAGSDLLLTNTWGANRFRLEEHGVTCTSSQVREINQAGAKLLRDVASASDRPIVCAGSVGPTGWIVCDPRDDAPKAIDRHELDYSAAVAAFTNQIAGLMEGGVDIIWIESQFGAPEVHAAIEACQAVGRSLGVQLPFVVSMTFSEAGRTELEYDIEHFAQEFGRAERRPIAIGFNCGFGPEVVLKLVGDHRAIFDGALPMLIKPNLGKPIWSEGGYVPIGLSEKQMQLVAKWAVDYGVRIVGACCGSLPEHINAMHVALRGYKAKAPPPTSELHRLLEAAR